MMLSHLISGPFRNFVGESSASYQSLVWLDLPGTNGRYRVALARKEVTVMSSSILIADSNRILTTIFLYGFTYNNDITWVFLLQQSEWMDVFRSLAAVP